MKITKLLSVLLLSLFVFNSCKKDDPVEEPPLGDYENGFFIVNEGNFGSGNASITFVSNDYATVEQNVYQTVNSEALGDTAQSIFMNDDKAYIILNASNKIEVVNRYTMESIATIDGGNISNPRYMETYNGFGYVSNWGSTSDSNDDFISVIDLSTNTVVGTISVTLGPEKIMLIGEKIYVAMKGAWGTNNKITVIDANTNLVITSIAVGDNPNSMLVKGNDLYVVSGGISWPTHTAGQIDKIDLSSHTVTKTWEMEETEHPKFLTTSASSLYYELAGEVYKWDGVSTNLPTTSEASLAGSYYGFAIQDNLLFTTNAADYVSEGSLEIFNLNTNTSVQVVTTGIIPNGIAFN